MPRRQQGPPPVREISAIPGEKHVFGKRLAQRPEEHRRVCLRRLQPRRRCGAQFPHAFEPLSAYRSRVRNRVERRTHVTADRRIERAIHSQFLRVDVDLNELRLRREQARAAQCQPVVDPLASHQKQVGFTEDRMDGVIQRRVRIAHAERMIVRDRAARHRDGVQAESACALRTPAAPVPLRSTRFRFLRSPPAAWPRAAVPSHVSRRGRAQLRPVPSARGATAVALPVNASTGMVRCAAPRRPEFASE